MPKVVIEIQLGDERGEGDRLAIDILVAVMQALPEGASPPVIMFVDGEDED